MSIAPVLEELTAFTAAERQRLVLRAVEPDDPGLSPEDEKLISTRHEDHRRDPPSAISPEAMKESIHSRLEK